MYIGFAEFLFSPAAFFSMKKRTTLAWKRTPRCLVVPRLLRALALGVYLRFLGGYVQTQPKDKHCSNAILHLPHEAVEIGWALLQSALHFAMALGPLSQTCPS